MPQITSSQMDIMKLVTRSFTRDCHGVLEYGHPQVMYATKLAAQLVFHSWEKLLGDNSLLGSTVPLIMHIGRLPEAIDSNVWRTKWRGVSFQIAG